MKKFILTILIVLVVESAQSKPPFLLITGTEPNWDRNIAVINRYLAEPLGLSTNWKAVKGPVQWQATTNARVKINVASFSLTKFTKGTNVMNQAWLDRLLLRVPVSSDVTLTITNSMKVVKDRGFEQSPGP